MKSRNAAFPSLDCGYDLVDKKDRGLAIVVSRQARQASRVDAKALKARKLLEGLDPTLSPYRLVMLR